LVAYFGDFAQNKYKPKLEQIVPTSDLLEPLQREYKTTLALTKIVEKCANKAVSKALDTLALPVVIKKCVEKLDVGGLSLQMVDCHPRNQEMRCAAEFAKRIRGSIDIYFISLEKTLCLQFAAVAYQLYDESIKQDKAITQNLEQIKEISLLPAV
jgi:hypothetical protein